MKVSLFTIPKQQIINFINDTLFLKLNSYFPDFKFISRNSDITWLIFDSFLLYLYVSETHIN